VSWLSYPSKRVLFRSSSPSARRRSIGSGGHTPWPRYKARLSFEAARQRQRPGFPRGVLRNPLPKSYQADRRAARNTVLVVDRRSATMRVASWTRKLPGLEARARAGRGLADPAPAVLREDPARLMALAGMAPDPWQERLLRSEADRVLLLCVRQ